MALPFLLHLLNFLPWWGLALRDWKANLPYLLASGVLLQFTWVSPCWLYANGVTSIAGIEYGAAFPEAMTVYIIGVGVFNTVWWVSKSKSRESPLPVGLPSPRGRRYRPKVRFMGGAGSTGSTKWIVNSITALCLSLALLSYQLSGMPVWKLLNPWNSDGSLNLYGMAVKYPVLEGFADALVPAAGLALLFGGPVGIGLVAISAWVLLISGFRFRLILLVLSLFFYGLMKVQPKLRPWLVGGTALAAGIGLTLLTVNRGLIVSRTWGSLGLFRENISAAMLVNETNNCQTFMACLASPYRQRMVPDGGRSLYWSTAVRFLPAAVFPRNKKPRAHTLGLIRLTYTQTEKSRALNPALSYVEEYYLSAGILGLALGMGFLGWLTAFLGSKIVQTTTPWKLFGWCMAAAFLFQMITRGYVPQQAELALYLSLPFLAMYGGLYLYHRYAGNPNPDLDAAPEDGPVPI